MAVDRHQRREAGCAEERLPHWYHWGCSVGSAGLAAMPQGQWGAVPRGTWWDVLLCVPADRQQTITDPRGLCRNTHILSAEHATGFHGGIH